MEMEEERLTKNATCKQTDEKRRSSRMNGHTQLEWENWVTTGAGSDE